MNHFEEVEPDTAHDFARELPMTTARGVLDGYKNESEWLTSAAPGLPMDTNYPYSIVDHRTVKSVRNAHPGTWVPVRKFPISKSQTARQWVSEVSLAELDSLGPLEARLEFTAESIAAYVRRAVPNETIMGRARRIAESFHTNQVDKAGQPYIDHPRRVADRLEARGASAETVAAGWLHDVLEDTKATAADLKEWGIPDETISVVEAVTKRPGESMENYAIRIVTTPLAIDVKRADLADNCDPHRLALLDEVTRTRLEAKYARMHTLLDAHSKRAPHVVEVESTNAAHTQKRLT